MRGPKGAKGLNASVINIDTALEPLNDLENEAIPNFPITLREIMSMKRECSRSGSNQVPEVNRILQPCGLQLEGRLVEKKKMFHTAA